VTYGPGIHRIPMAEYIADCCEVPSLSSGCAWRLINESPFHAWTFHPRLGNRQRPSSNVADTGSTAHDLLLGGEGKICVIDPNLYPAKSTGEIPKGWTNNAIRAARDEARANGLVPMLAGEMIGVRAMVGAAREFVARSEIAGVFDAGESELTVIAQDDGAILKTRPDWLNLRAGISLSYKSTKASVHPERFARMMETMGYGFQNEFYRRALSKAGSLGVRHIILAQQQDFPYACALFELSPQKSEMVAADVERAVNIWRRCMESNEWPGYGGQVHVIEPRPWEIAGDIEVEYE
jgi:hypothetical protein